MSTIFQDRPQEEIDKLQKTLKILVEILTSSRVEYRIFGSIVPASILGKPQRKIGDIDLLLDEKDKEGVLQRLKNNNFKIIFRQYRVSGFKCGMDWIETESEDLNQITIFLGNFDKEKNFNIYLSQNIKITVHHWAIKPTDYQFKEANYIGIPLATAYYGAWISRGNPKRKYDLAVFEMKNIEKPAKNYAIIDFYYKDKKIPFLYSFVCFLENFFGKISVLMGGNYDFWRKEK